MSKAEKINEMSLVLLHQQKLIEETNDLLTKLWEAKASYDKLTEYYYSEEWQNDYDNCAELNNDVNKACLSQDSIYDLLTEQDNLNIRLMEIGLLYLKK